MRGIFSNRNENHIFLMMFPDVPSHELPYQASSSPIPGTQLWPIRICFGFALLRYTIG